MKLGSLIELYRCFVLTVIAVLLGVVLWRMPGRPLTLEGARAAGMTPAEWKRKIPLVYVGAGSIDVDSTVEVEVQNTVDVSGSVVSVDR
jgi:hypothetical protein